MYVIVCVLDQMGVNERAVNVITLASTGYPADRAVDISPLSSPNHCNRLCVGVCVCVCVL